MTRLVSVSGLCVRYVDADRDALSDISLTFDAGERLAIIGESGSGKSTLALALAGLLQPGTRQSGSVVWPRRPGGPRNGADIGFVFQDPSASLDPVMRVGRQVAEVVHAHTGKGWPEAMADAGGLFAQVQLDRTLADRYPHQLSGGQKQRVAIAAAIAAGPALLIADEPTSALDMIVQGQIVRLIASLVAEKHMALLMITHDLALAASVADRVAVLHDGRLVEQGSAREVLSRPGQPYTRMLVSKHVDLDRQKASA